jgi:ribosomal protein S18 acetylase RimI-like enzyme
MSLNQTHQFIELMTAEYEERIRKIPFLNLDTFIIPTPFIGGENLVKDYAHSYVWNEEGEILGYLLVYSNAAAGRYHIYKQSSSPFSRGKGIGSAFIDKLATELSPESVIYLYVWEKNIDSIHFFESRGFKKIAEVADRKLMFYRMEARAEYLHSTMLQHHTVVRDKVDELGKTRHDARKNIALMLDMVNMLSVDNCARIIEDINRETTSLISILNSYEDKVERFHKLDLKELILERIIPFIEVSQIPCEIRLSLHSGIPNVIANYVEVGRALINIVSNSLDAIQEKGDFGLIEISLRDEPENVVLEICDNGIGIAKVRLERGDDGMPLFVGHTTKNKAIGQGIGTKQIFSTFGPENIRIESEPDNFMKWIVFLKKEDQKKNTLIESLSQRYQQFEQASELMRIDEKSPRAKIASFIWLCRKTEILAYDLIFQFSLYNNIRELYRNTLLYRYGGKDDDFLKNSISSARIDYPQIAEWLFNVIKTIKLHEAMITRYTVFNDYAGMLFKSYGQALDRTIIFTLDPESGRFYATDRKLAEHFDFVPYLNNDRERLLRGEIKGDVRNAANPVYLGVWTVLDEEDIYSKMRLIQKGAAVLIRMGINPAKRLCFYHSTYNNHFMEINPNASTTLSVFASLDNEGFKEFFSRIEDEIKGLSFAD